MSYNVLSGDSTVPISRVGIIKGTLWLPISDGRTKSAVESYRHDSAVRSVFVKSLVVAGSYSRYTFGGHRREKTIRFVTFNEQTRLLVCPDHFESYRKTTYEHKHKR